MQRGRIVGLASTASGGLVKKLTIGLLVLACLLCCAGSPALAEEEFDRGKYVPREEYEKLMRRFEDVVKRLDALEKRQAASASAAWPCPISRRP